jgi:integrase
LTTEPIHQLSSGRWELRYRDPNGRPRRLRFDTKGQAKDHLATVRTKGIEGSYIAPERGRITFGAWCDQWWATKVDLRARTLARYERDLRLHIRPRFERRALAKITKTEVQSWVAEMRRDGVPDSGVRRRFSVFRAVMTGAVEDERLVKSPCKGIRLPEVGRGEIEVLSPEEVSQLAAVMPEWCRSWVWVAAWSGLRWSEMVGLRRRDVDLLWRRFIVSQQVVEVGSTFKGFDTPKTDAGRRSVPIWPSIVAVLEEQLATRAQPGRDGLVFVNTRGNTPHLSSFTSQTWKKARTRIGRPDLRWHDLRHTYVAIRIAAGAHPKEIQEECGHSSYKTTMDIYGHLFESSAERTAEAMEEMYEAAQKAPASTKITAIA